MNTSKLARLATLALLMNETTGTQPGTGAAPTPTPPAPKADPAPKAARKPSKPKVAKKAKAPKPAPKKAKTTAARKKQSGKGPSVLKTYAKQYVKDTKHKTAGGNTSIHNGDKTAKALLGKSLDEVYSAASKALNEPVTTLKKKYGHLNQGMQRMNLGNRMRAA